MTLARELARALLRTSFHDLPLLAVERAKMVIASTIASAAAGSDISSARIIRLLARERGGTPEASIWFDAAPRLPVADAARVNAVMSDAAASDDSDLRNIAHIGTIIAATSLGMAERTGATGQDVLTAMVLGYEVAGRIGEAITPGFSRRGFHASVVTIFGGAAAAGRLLNLTEPQFAQALAIAATSIGGLRAAADTSLAREYHAGLSAMLGVNAALAAQKGYIVEESILEARGGYLETFGATAVEGITQGLGNEWDIITEMGIKLVPGAHPNHAAAEAAAEASRKGNVAPADVDSIVVAGPRLTGTRVFHPTDLIGMAHSLPYFVAAGVADRDFSWVHASMEKILDPVIGELQDKVSIDTSPEQDPELGRYAGATVTITTRSGEKYSSTVRAPRGSGARVDWADIDSKYRTLVPRAQLLPENVEGSLDVIHRFERVQSISELLHLLRR